MAPNARSLGDRLGYGTKTVPLDTDHTAELLQIPNATGIAVLKADAPADITIQDSANAAIAAKDIGSLNFRDTPVDSLYVTNDSADADAGDELVILWSKGTIEADPNTPDEIDVVDRGSRSLGDVNVTDRSGRELGKSRLEDSAGVLIDPATADQLANQSGVAHGQDDVTAAGTAEPLNGGSAHSTPDAATLTIRANTGNAGDIYVGDSGVTTNNGFVLGQGESISIDIDDVSTVHVDADNNGDAVSWIVEE